MDYILLIGGLLLLVVSGEFLVRGGVVVAKHFKISTLVIGVTVVSLGTSAPELLVSLQAALTGHPDISIGNVVGSNISNIALVLALMAIFLPIAVKKESITFDWPFMMVASIILFLFMVNGNMLYRWEGAILFAGLVGFVVYSIVHSRKNYKEEEDLKVKYPIWIAVLFILGSCVGLAMGADWLVKGASGIAREFGVSERVISVTIIAFGTSVPELVTSLIAAFKKQLDISVGNIIGSNIFNILGILGVTSIVCPIDISKEILSIDIWWMLAISLALGLFMLPIKKGMIQRYKGVILLVSYITYIIFVFGK